MAHALLEPTRHHIIVSREATDITIHFSSISASAVTRSWARSSAVVRTTATSCGFPDCGGTVRSNVARVEADQLHAFCKMESQSLQKRPELLALFTNDRVESRDRH